MASKEHGQRKTLHSQTQQMLKSSCPWQLQTLIHIKPLTGEEKDRVPLTH